MQVRETRVAGLTCTLVAPESGAFPLPILFIHGLGGGRWGWENFQRRAAAQGWRSYAIELPLHDLRRDSPPDPRLGDYSVESFALACAAALAEIGDCFVVGHSMGGLIAQKLAENFPRPGYVFLCSAPPWHMMRRAYWPMWKHLLRHPVREIFRSINGDTMALDEALENELVNNRLAAEQRHAVYERDAPDSGRASLQMALGLVKVDERRVHSPRLVVGGLADRLIPPCEQRKLAERYQCPLRLFDRGHMLIIEDGWEEVADALFDWMTAIADDGRAKFDGMASPLPTADRIAPTPAMSQQPEPGATASN